MRVLPSVGLLLCFGLLAGCDQARQQGTSYEPQTVRLDPEEAARHALVIQDEVGAAPADGLTLSLWASEELVIDPIALDVDTAGRVYVTGSARSGGLLDIRGHQEWFIDALKMNSVDDLRAFYRSELNSSHSDENTWLPDFNSDGSRDWRDLTVNKERLYRLEDASGDGVADVAHTLMEGFDTEVTDVAGGLMVHGADVYIGAAPDVWHLPGVVSEGRVSGMQSISHGYSTHPGYFGHGVSGVTLGPDGRLYWSVGDMGFNVVGPDGRRWSYPHQGAILRSELDGSGFEVFAAGLRNTHEFDFDEYGNLISVDNDGDHPGETERVVYIVEGSDSGWRVNWQFGKYTDPDNNDYKVWMDEGLFKPRFEGQAAYLTPPVAAYHAGPTGMVYNPGTALNYAWRDRFFVSEYTGTQATSRIHAFRLEEEGAGFALADERVALSGIQATGIEFGPDGALYVADWISGWDANGKGRVWKLDTSAPAASEERAETAALLAASFEERAADDVAQLLRHADRRVRLKAQMELAARADEERLLEAARQRNHRLARLHGLWGLGQLARQETARAAHLTAFLDDDDAEVRAQAAEVLGDVRYEPAAPRLVALLEDEAARPRFFAAEALGRLGYSPAAPALVAMLEANDDRDVYLRHAGALALARLGDADAVAALERHPSRAVRLAAVVALRRMRHPAVAHFLDDADEAVATEAARAANDDGAIEAAVPALARSLETTSFTNEALLRRALNANLRVGTAEAARRVAAYARRDDAPEAMRTEAVAILGVWPAPSEVDRVDGVPWTVGERDVSAARAATRPLVTPLFDGDSAPVRVALAETAARLELEVAAPALLERLRSDRAAEVRVAALRALAKLDGSRAREGVPVALSDREASVRLAALELIPALDLPEATTVELLGTVLDRGTVDERQRALAVLGCLDGDRAHALLGRMLDDMAAGELTPELHLDLEEAIHASNSDTLVARLVAHLADRPAGDSLAEYRAALFGGDADAGRRVVFRHSAAQCARCHAFDIEGPDVGPELSGIGAVLSREQLLEALVVPSARIAPGYGTVTLTLQNGETLSGTLVEESASHLVVQAGGTRRQIDTAEVGERTNAPSGMPPMGRVLTRRELRDVVEFLSTQR